MLACLGPLGACGGGGGDDPPVPGPPPPPAAFTIGGTVTGLVSTGLVIRSSTGSEIAVASSGPFTFPTAIAGGTAYSVTIGTQPSRGPAQQCTVANGSGTVGSAPVTNIAVTCTTRVNKFVYVPNAGSGTVSAFSIDATTGALSPVAGSPFASGVTPRTAAASNSGTSLYVTNEGSAAAPPRISAYTINATTGALVSVAGSPFDVSTPPPPSALTPLGRPLLHPSGSIVYVSSAASAALYGATVDAASGSLTPLPSFPIGTGLGRGVFTANGNVLFMPHDSLNGGADGAIAAYSVHQSSGVLTSIGVFPTAGRVPAGVALNPEGTLLFVPNAASGTIAVFRVDSMSGTLTAAAGSPFDWGVDTIPAIVTVHPFRNFVYATNSFVFSNPTTSSVSAFQFDATSGVLTPIAGSPFTTGGGQAGVARIEPSGKFMYVSNHFSATVQAYAIDQTSGALTSLPGSPFATGSMPSVVEIDASGKYLYVASADTNTVSSYAIDGATGVLTLVGSAPTGMKPSSVEVVGLQ
jgi:6-phosphogluconolactonase